MAGKKVGKLSDKQAAFMQTAIQAGSHIGKSANIHAGQKECRPVRQMGSSHTCSHTDMQATIQESRQAYIQVGREADRYAVIQAGNRHTGSDMNRQSEYTKNT